MRSLDLLVKNGMVVTERGAQVVDIAVNQGRIVAVEPELDGGPGTEIIDAYGKLVLPGIVDAHTHFALRSRDTTTADDFASGSISAACGGVTTVIDFADVPPGMGLVDAVNRRVEEAQGHVAVDFGLHLTLNRFTPEIEAQLGELVDFGVNSIKVFTTYRREGYMMPEDELERLFQAATGLGLVVQVHAEDNETVELLTEQFLKEGKLQAHFHPLSRSPETEAKAIYHVLKLAEKTGVKVYFVHVSTRVGMEGIHLARQTGLPVMAETCPHYLLLDDSLYLEDFPERFIMTPPLRKREDNEALWQGVEEGLFSTIATDHCAFDLAQKREHCSFADTLPGIPGVETLLPLMYTEGVLRRNIPLTRLVTLLSTGPARVFGLYPIKGEIAPGSDADLVIIDPDKEVLLEAAHLHSRAGYTPYEGWLVRGYPEHTILRGREISRNGQFIGSAGSGRFVKAQARGPQV